MNAQSRQPKGIPVGGQFATSAHAESGVSLADVREADYSTWTPVEVDTELARLYGEHAVEMQRYSMNIDDVAREVARNKGQRGFGARANRVEIEDAIETLRAQDAAGEPLDYNERTLLRTYDRASGHLAAAAEAKDAMAPLEEEFTARGGWTRAFLVANQNGHVHSSMDCSTCFQPGFDGTGRWREGTRYHWVTEMSDHSEEEIVDAAGERACTVCYPSAPIETLNKPTRLFTPDEIEKAKAREEREKAKQAREAAKIEKGLTADGSEFKVGWVENSPGFDYVDGQQVHVVRPREKSERFKTERAATTWLVQEMVWNGDRADGRPSERQPAYDAIIEAIAAKHDRSVDEVRADIDKKVAAKRKRDGYDT